MTLCSMLRSQVLRALAFFTSLSVASTTPASTAYIDDDRRSTASYNCSNKAQEQATQCPHEDGAKRVDDYSGMACSGTKAVSQFWNMEKEAEASRSEEYGNEAKWELLGSGKSGIVYGIDATRVLKMYHDEEAGQIEHQVYRRLGSHPNIAKLLETQSNGSIILERGIPLRDVCRAPSFSDTPLHTRIRWLRHSAEGYRHVHACDIVHGDVGCGNQVLIEGAIKLIDFEGCSVDGGIAGSCYEWFSYRPSQPRVTHGTDIFAFGCAMYEVSTGRPPYHELEISNNKYREVEELYTKNSFPDVMELPLGELIQRCWNGDIGSMEEIIKELDAISLGYQS